MRPLIDVECYFPSIDWDYTVEDKTSLVSVGLAEHTWVDIKARMVELCGDTEEIRGALGSITNLIDGCIFAPLTYFEASLVLLTMAKIEKEMGTPYVSTQMMKDYPPDATCSCGLRD